MKSVSSYAAVLVVLNVLGTAGSTWAQDIRGAWQIRSYTIRTQTLDGKKTLKGPFKYKSSTTKIQIDDDTYTETNKWSRIVYALRKERDSYFLERPVAGGTFSVRLTNIRKIAGELRFTSVRRDPQRNEQTSIEWIYAPLDPTTIAAHPLKDTQWELVAITPKDGKPVQPQKGETITLFFRYGNQIVGKAGNNRFTGFYTPGTDQSLTFGGIAATKMAAPPGSLGSTSLKALASTEKFQFAQGFLILEMPADKGTMKLRRVSN